MITFDEETATPARLQQDAGVRKLYADLADAERGAQLLGLPETAEALRAALVRLQREAGGRR